ncbi:MAG: DUF2782 domain-containing protein [Gammaproteobacteria bacterium]
MNVLKSLLLVIIALAHPLRMTAAETEGLEALPEPPPPPPDVVQSGQPLDEPEVTIIKRKDATIEEHRLNGHLYMLKVTPVIGKPYYLLDSDGDGVMETNMSEIYSDFVVPQWVLFSW